MNDVLFFRVFNGTQYEDRVFVRNLSIPIGNNCWIQLDSFAQLLKEYPDHKFINLTLEQLP